MCTVALRIATVGSWPIRMVAVRDELYARGTRAPAAHWPERDPALVGVLDLQAGGTPLAIHCERRAVAVLVNATPHAIDARRGRTAPTRGMLPLLAASGEDITPSTLCDLPGFHLLVAMPDGDHTRNTAHAAANGDGTGSPQKNSSPIVELLSWDGSEMTSRRVEAGDHVLTSAGLDMAGHERGGRVSTALALVPSEVPVNSSPWRAVAAEAVVDDLDLPDGRYGTVGASAIALSSESVSYEMCVRPGETSWITVLPSEMLSLVANNTSALVTTHAA